MRTVTAVLAIILLLSVSCHRSKLQQGSTGQVSKPLIITPDSSLFRKGGVWPDSPFEFNFLYPDKTGLNDEWLTLKQGEDSRLPVNSPIYLKAQREPCPYLVYPGEHITVKREEDETLSYTVEANAERNNELKITKILYQKSHEKPYSFFGATYNIKPADSLLQTEALVEAAIPLICYNGMKLIDSLSSVYPVGGKFKTYLAEYFQATSRQALQYQVLFNYKDQYVRQHLYKEKVRQVINSYGNIPDRAVLSFLKTDLDGLFTYLVEDNKIKWLIRTDAQFADQYKFTQNNFQGLARDYLLTKIMYWSITHDLKAAYDYMERFRQDCRDEAFKRVIENELTLRKRLYRKLSSPEGNFLLDIKLKKKKGIADVINAFGGNVVLIDFWASWCKPCREELVAARELEKKYAGKKIRFMYVSLDRDIASWKNACAEENLLHHPNYILLNSNHSSFVKEFNINTIPRYILIGKDGSVVNANAPAPSDAALQQLIDAHLP